MITTQFIEEFNKTFKTDFKLKALPSGRIPDSLFTPDNLSYIYKEDEKYEIRLMLKDHSCSFCCQVERLIVKDIIEAFKKHAESELEQAKEVYNKSLEFLKDT